MNSLIHLLIRRRRQSILALLAFVCALIPAGNIGSAQPSQHPQDAPPQFDATSLREPTELNTPWLVHDGDRPEFARPEFDDSAWTRFDDRNSVTPLFPNHPPQVLWYRLHVKVSPGQTGLALLEHQLASAFEIYVNGQKILQTGRVAPFVPYTFGARIVKPIPASMVASGGFVIALRVHISLNEWETGGPGLAAENLVIGQEDTLRDRVLLTELENGTANWVNNILAFGLGIVALALFTAQRRQLEYLWIFLQNIAIVCALPLSIYELSHNVATHWDLLRQLAALASLLFQILMFMAFLRVGLSWWVRALCWLAAIGLIISSFGRAQGSLPVLAAIFAQVPLLFLLAGFLPVLLVTHFRKGNREAGILLIPILLASIDIYLQLFAFGISTIPALRPAAIQLSDILQNFKIGPFVVGLNQFDNLLFLLSLAIIMVLRSTRVSRQQAVFESELEAARQVQQVILPEAIEAVPGFTIESAYQPAQQVGGDYFQVLPDGAGGLLLVIGDVAGKGLPAAMLVSVMVGAIRSAAEYTTDPAELLANLNDRLVGRSAGAFSTALVAHIDDEGVVTVANAGHLSPYLDGREVELPGALPLGVASGAVYETTRFELRPGSRLAFYSDGVIEAQNRTGELFGFDRGLALSQRPAAEIAAAAKEFGQSDDITVVVIARTAVTELVAAS